MGLVICIEGDYPCGNGDCHKSLNDWQSKDLSYEGYDLALGQAIGPLNEKMTGEIHAMCAACGCWTQCQVKDGQIVSKNVSKVKSYVEMVEVHNGR